MTEFSCAEGLGPATRRTSRRNDAVPSLEGFAEGRKSSEGLGSCARQFVSGLVILREEWNQTPSHQRQFAVAFVVETYNGEEGTRRDVIVGAKTTFGLTFFA